MSGADGFSAAEIAAFMELTTPALVQVCARGLRHAHHASLRPLHRACILPVAPSRRACLCRLVVTAYFPDFKMLGGAE